MAFFLRKKEKKIAAIFHFLFFSVWLMTLSTMREIAIQLKKGRLYIYISPRECNDGLVQSVVVNVDIVTQSV